MLSSLLRKYAKMMEDAMRLVAIRNFFPPSPHLASGENLTSMTVCWWPVILAAGFLSSPGLQRKSVWSSLPETISSPPPAERMSESYL